MNDDRSTRRKGAFSLPLRRRAAVLSLLALVACEKPEERTEEVRPVQALKISAGETESQSSYSGEVKARYETNLGFRVGGKIVERSVEVGGSVRPGMVLARLDPKDLALSAESARSQTVAAQADFDQAKADLARYANLLEKRFISPAEYDRRLNVYNVAKAKLEQAHAQLSVSQNQAAYATLRADQAGVVTAIEAEVGQVVAAGQPVVRVARPEEKEIVISVPENRLDEMRAGGQIRISLWANPDRTYHGRVREISPNADPVTRTYAAKISVPDADAAMRLGMTATVVFSRAERAGTVRLPFTALYQQNDKPSVWIVDPATSTVSLQPIAVAAYRDNEVTVASGLKEGQLVVTAGVHKLYPGQKVRVLEKPAPGAAATSASAAPPTPPNGPPARKP